MRIGIFDSGLGGLGVYKEILRLMPSIEAYYISDLAYCPYGEKTQEQISQRCHWLTEKLLPFDVQLMVVACNTATAHAIDELRKNYNIPFVGVEPFLNYINKFKNGPTRVPPPPFRPVVLLTKASANSSRFKSLLKKLNLENQVDVFPCEGLASLIEDHLHERKEESFIKSLHWILSPLLGQGYTHAILGCTHYPYVSAEIEAFLKVECVAPEAYVAQRILKLLQGMPESLPLKNDPISTSSLNFQQVSPHLFLAVTQQDPNLKQKLRIIFPELL